MRGDDLFSRPTDQAEVEFENAGGETFICGNPPYLGSTWQTKEQKADLKAIFEKHTKSWKSLDYVAGWFMKATDYGLHTPTTSAFVSTNSICQGQQVPILWPLIFKTGHEIVFAHTSFTWANLASYNAGVTVIIVGISNSSRRYKYLTSINNNDEIIESSAANINAYLVSGMDIIVAKASKPLNGMYPMTFGSKPVDGGNLLLSSDDLNALDISSNDKVKFIKQIYGSSEFINGTIRYCVWIKDELQEEAKEHPIIGPRIDRVKKMRLSSKKAATRKGAEYPHRFDERRQVGDEIIVVVPAVSSGNRPYLPCGYLPQGSIITNRNFGVFNGPILSLSILTSTIHRVWIDSICGKLRTDYNYSNTLGWNTFPLPTLNRQKQSRSNHLRRRNPPRPRAPFPRHHRRPLRAG